MIPLKTLSNANSSNDSYDDYSKVSKNQTDAYKEKDEHYNNEVLDRLDSIYAQLRSINEILDSMTGSKRYLVEQVNESKTSIIDNAKRDIHVIRTSRRRPYADSKGEFSYKGKRARIVEDQSAASLDGPSTKHKEVGIQKAKSEELQCPYCKEKLNVSIPADAGSTIRVTCTNCGCILNLHRNENYGIKIRVAKDPSAMRNRVNKMAVKQLEHENTRDSKFAADAISYSREERNDTMSESFPVRCQGCHQLITISGRRNHTKKEVKRVCINCGCKLTINVQKQKITNCEKGEVLASRILEGRGNRLLLQCPEDSYPLLTTFKTQDGEPRAYCRKHQLALKPIPTNSQYSDNQSVDSDFLSDR
ncbi:hypothetical protein [Bifidobacterium sp. ESL0704]|uniref:hypothetical protein n=1 Tax=Bifidobacterium sp. ESL0704 TaxID=2983219 RepID=UPI0023FA1CD4|nr:hypothetical protein [Bifidobacterium sp. ESL0704]WEV52600.1 hypothetical protein OZX64_06895 [Bifidobacterium sp. ESL0704]